MVVRNDIVFSVVETDTPNTEFQGITCDMIFRATDLDSSFTVLARIIENDVVATEEIRLGDNDTLAAMVCNLINADLMIILTDQDGLFDKDPTTNDDAELIRECKIQDLSISDLEFNSKSKFGTGGFKTKLNSIKIAGTSGTTSIIASGHLDGVISKAINGLEVGTIFFPNKSTK